MDLSYTPAQQAFRKEVKDWLKTHVPQQAFASYDTREGFEQHRQWEALLASVGFSSITWPTALGGRGCNLIEWLIFEEEYWAIDAPQRVNQNGILLFGPTLMEFGTPEQKARFCHAPLVAMTCGPKAGASPTQARTWRPFPAAPSAMAITM